MSRGHSPQYLRLLRKRYGLGEFAARKARKKQRQKARKSSQLMLLDLNIGGTTDTDRELDKVIRERNSQWISIPAAE